MGPAGPQGVKGDPGPAGLGGFTIIPFASHTAPYLSTDNSGYSLNVSSLAFGLSYPAIKLEQNGTIILSGDNQDAFSLPFDAVIENIYVVFNTYVSFTFPDGITVYPFLCLYSAASDDNTFAPLLSTKLRPDTGYSGSVPKHTTRTASVQGIGLSLLAGTRILIGAQMEISGSSNLGRSYYFYFNGGIGLGQ
jgi:hypothetical protein